MYSIYFFPSVRTNGCGSHTDAMEQNDLQRVEINKSAFHLATIDFLQGKPQSCLKFRWRELQGKKEIKLKGRGFEMKLISVIEV